jgi:hypothetical protein
MVSDVAPFMNTPGICVCCASTASGMSNFIPPANR